MSVETAEKTKATEALPQTAPARKRGRRSTAPGLAILAQGEPFVWLTGGALVVCVLMILGLLVLVVAVGTQTFWPKEILRVELYDGRVHMGEIAESDEYRLALDAAENGPKEIVRVALGMMGDEFDISVESKAAEVAEVLVEQGQVVSADTEIMRLKQDGSDLSVKAGHAGQIIELNYKPGESVPADAEVPLARVKTSFGISVEDASLPAKTETILAPATISEMFVKELDRVAKGDKIASLKLADDTEVIVHAPEAGQIIGVFGKSGGVLKQADALLVKLKTEGPMSIAAERRKLETGNFQLTNVHFDWVEGYSIVPDGESKPEWAIVAERVEYGRFYGIPTEFAVRTEREIPADEKELAEIVNFFGSKNYLLFEVADAVAQEEPDEKSKRAKELLDKYKLTSDELFNTVTLLQPLQDKLKAERQENVDAFLKEFKAAEGVRLDAVLDGGKKIVPIADVEPGQNIVEVQEVYVGSESAWEKYEEYHGQVRERFDEWYRLKKHDIGKINAREEQTRLGVRQKELDMREFDPKTGKRKETLFIVDTTDGLWDAQNQEIRPLDNALDEYEETVAAVQTRLGSPDDQLVRTASLIKDLLTDEIDNLKAPTIERMSRLRESLSKAPESAKKVVEDYLEVKRAAVADQQAIESKMAELVKENDRYQLRAETTTTESLFSNVAVSGDDVRVLRGGDLPDSLRQAFDTFFQSDDDKLGSKLTIEESSLKGKFYITDETDEHRVKNLILFVKDGQAEGRRYVWKTLSLNDIVRAYPANRLSLGQRLGVYFSRWREFLLDDPREANSAGGVFPAIWGTIAMTIIMSLIVVPFGVLSSLYLREYAKGGAIVSAVRISINNLAGVPSIVFGIFGLSFFIYKIGAYVDGGPAQATFTPWPPATWFMFLAITAVLAVGAFFFGLSNIIFKGNDKKGIKSAMSLLSMLLWIAATIVFFVVVFKTPYFTGLNEAKLPNPTFGKEGMLWASLTLALLTLPVVIVATEEALSAVPNSLREGSYASGASKWQTIRRIVLPHAMPGIMTGMILAMARGAGEVAPLMLVGVKKATSELPFDGNFPYMHVDRSFMHLGFHIYDIGFQSPNSEAAKPMVYTTTLLLIGIIALLNIAAIAIRGRLRKQFKSAQF